MILQYGIDPDDIYNFDGTGFAMCLTATAKVVTWSQYYGRRSVLQPGNREWSDWEPKTPSNFVQLHKQAS